MPQEGAGPIPLGGLYNFPPMAWFHEFLSEAQFRLKRRPTFEREPLRRVGPFLLSPFPEARDGGLVLSADFELAWAWRMGKHSPDARLMARQARRNIPKLLQIFDTYRVPITWATVGHLFLESCSCPNGIPHPDMPRPGPFETDKWIFQGQDWYEVDPCSDYRKDPEYYAPDLIQAILHAQVEHDIGLHTFSHVPFHRGVINEDIARREIEASIEAAARWGLTPRSWVFPGGYRDFRELLAEYGIVVYRGAKTQQELRVPTFEEKWQLWNVPTSYGVGPRPQWSFRYYVQRRRRYLDRAVATRTVFHWWFHPSLSPELVHQVMEPVLAYAWDLQRHHQLWVGTLYDLASYREALRVLRVQEIAEGKDTRLRLEGRPDARFKSYPVYLELPKPEFERRLRHVEGPFQEVPHPTKRVFAITPPAVLRLLFR